MYGFLLVEVGGFFGREVVECPWMCEGIHGWVGAEGLIGGHAVDYIMCSVGCFRYGVKKLSTGYPQVMHRLSTILGIVYLL